MKINYLTKDRDAAIIEVNDDYKKKSFDWGTLLYSVTPFYINYIAVDKKEKLIEHNSAEHPLSKDDKCLEDSLNTLGKLISKKLRKK